MQPATPLHGLEGMKHLETAIVPGIYDASVADENVTVETEDAQAMTRRLAREEGLFVGVSSGANVFAALRIRAKIKNRSGHRHNSLRRRRQILRRRFLGRNVNQIFRFTFCLQAL